MTFIYGIGAVVFQIFNLIRHPDSYTAAWILAGSSVVALGSAIYGQHQYRTTFR